MDLEALIKQLMETANSAVSGFDAGLQPVQRQIYNDIEMLVKNMDLKNGQIQNTVKNLKTIGQIKMKLQTAIRSAGYLKNVKTYINQFDAISKVQNEYFSQLSEQKGPSELLKTIKDQSIQSTVESLTEAGVNANVGKGVQDILKRNITGGGNYNDLLDQMRTYLLDDRQGLGALAKYTKQITTDSINQFSAQYTQAVTEDLGLNWFMYTGSNKDTTRELCAALTKKKWIHRSELSEICRGYVDGKRVTINPRTGLWYGAIPGTNEFNFQVNRGGYGCDHQLVPVSATVVPLYLQEKFKDAA